MAPWPVRPVAQIVLLIRIIQILVVPRPHHVLPVRPDRRLRLVQRRQVPVRFALPVVMSMGLVLVYLVQLIPIIPIIAVPQPQLVSLVLPDRRLRLVLIHQVLVRFALPVVMSMGLVLV